MYRKVKGEYKSLGDKQNHNNKLTEISRTNIIEKILCRNIYVRTAYAKGAYIRYYKQKLAKSKNSKVGKQFNQLPNKNSN